MDVLSDYYGNELTLFSDKTLDAGKALTVGEYPLDKSADKNKLAALMKTISTIYNLEETITKT